MSTGGRAPEPPVRPEVVGLLRRFLRAERFPSPLSAEERDLLASATEQEKRVAASEVLEDLWRAAPDDPG